MEKFDRKIINTKNEELPLTISSISYKFLPFIREMMRKVKGTALETKWQMMHDLIVVSKKK